jgi:hypothetical protein
MNFKVLAVLVVSFALTVVSVLAAVSGSWLIAVPCGWSGVVGLLLTFNYCAGTRNKQLDEEIDEHVRIQRDQKQAA